MATKTTTRLYRTLNPGEIRLVTLLPGSSDEIKCKLSHSNLVEKEKFEALSYAWGHSSLPRKSITVDGIQVPVGPNLWDALHHFRLCSHSKEKVLWIDALCINQSDDLEKGVQIQKMRDVYGTASRVLIWLGKASVNSDLAMRFVDRFVNVDIEAPNVDAWTALQELFQRAWWTRSWVLQEVAMASSDPLVICGKRQLPWSKFRVFHGRVAYSTSRRARATIPPTLTVLLTFWKSHEYMGSSIGFLLMTSYQFQASDPRDKVYSLLGLATEKDRTALKPPDYSKSVRQVFLETAKYILRVGSIHINYLSFNTNSGLYDLPSWVPDWSLSTRRWPLWMVEGYKASGNIGPTMRSRVSGILQVKGIVVDEICYFDGKSRTVLDQDPSLVQGEPEVLDNIEDLLNETIRKKPCSRLPELHPSRSDALWRTLVTDRSLEGNVGLPDTQTPAPNSYGNMYEVHRGRSSVPDDYKPEYPMFVRRLGFTQPMVNSLQIGDQRFFITKHQRIGLGSHRLKQGDLVVILFGADMPFLLRNKGTHFTLLGCAYVHGIMYGELFPPGKKFTRRMFKLG